MNVCMVLTASHVCRAQSEVASVNADEFTRTIITLKRAALQFGTASFIIILEHQ